MNNKRLLFSVTKKDFERQTFRCPGKGGQNVNKRDSGVRLIHRASGAVGHSCTHREQARNQEEAFQRLLKTPEWVNWHRVETARRMGTTLRETEAEMLARIDREMQEDLRDGQILEETF